MAEEEVKEEIAIDEGDENVDLNEPETKKLKLDDIEVVEAPSSPEGASTTPSKKLRPKLSKEQREADKTRKAEERRIKEEERKREKERVAEEKRLEKERKDKEREDKKKEEQRLKEEKKKAQEDAKEQKKREEEEKQRQKALKKKEDEERLASKKREEEEKKEAKEAKRREELEEMKKKQRESAKFLGFFKKLNKEENDESEAPEEGPQKVWYKPYLHKVGAVHAPIHRRTHLSSDSDLLTQHDEITASTYLHSDAVKNRKLKCARKDKLKAKLFQFHDNFRPPYYGTWKKKDSGVKPKKPWLPASENIDYEGDSDADWENEPDDGDECKSDEEDPEVDEQDSDADEFMVEPGYLSDGEGQEESDESRERDAEGRAERLAARASEWKRNVLNKSKLVHECQVQLALFRHATQGIGTAQDGASLRREVETAGRACLKACEAARNCVLPQLRHEGVEFTRNASQFIGCVAAYVVEMKRCVALERTFPAPTEPSITPQMIANMESMLETLENLITVHFSTSESSPTDKVTPRRRRATSCRPQCVCSKLKTSYA